MKFTEDINFQEKEENQIVIQDYENNRRTSLSGKK